MLHFDNPTVHLRRPVIVTSVAQALGVKPFELLAELIQMQVFVAPHQGLDDNTVFRLGERIGVDFCIEDGGSTNPIHIRPIGPVSPAPLTDADPMPQALDFNDWKSIRFEGVDLPQSLMGISILISIDDFTERTGDWIWKLPHCKRVRKSGPSRWCHDSAVEIIDHMIEHREAVLAMIQERLVPHGFNPAATLSEWLAALMTIREISAKTKGECSWLAADAAPASGRIPDRFMPPLDSRHPKQR